MTFRLPGEKLPEGLKGFPDEPDRVEVATLFRYIGKLEISVSDEEWLKTQSFISKHVCRTIWNRQVLFMALEFIVDFIFKYSKDKLPRS